MSYVLLVSGWLVFRAHKYCSGATIRKATKISIIVICRFIWWQYSPVFILIFLIGDACLLCVTDVGITCLLQQEERVRLLACLYSNTKASVMGPLLTLLILEPGREQCSCKITSWYEDVLHSFAEYNWLFSILHCKNSLHDQIYYMSLVWIVRDLN